MTTMMLMMMVPLATAVATDALPQLSLQDGLKSVMMEFSVLVIFLLTWTVSRYVMKYKRDLGAAKVDERAGLKRAKRKDPAETAQIIMGLCQEQFTRGLRLYRELVKTGADKEIVDEEFYTALAEASVRVNKPDVAEQVLTRMHANGLRPSCNFIQSVLKLFASRKLYAECILVHRMFGATLEPHPVVYSCTTVAACETGDLDLARSLLEEASTHFKISSREWLALMRAHVRRKAWPDAIRDLRELMSRNMPIDNIVFNTVLSACSASPTPESLAEMKALLGEVQAHEKKFSASEDAPKSVDIVSFNTMMKAYARAGDVEACFALLEECTVEPDDVTFSTLLDVCIDEDEHQLASVALERMANAGVKMNCVVMTTLMKGFVRSKRLDKAMQLYESMQMTSSPVKPDMITHSMLIKAHCDAHDMGAALRILESMLQQDCPVDDVVFTHLIEGCCQVNNVRLAEKLFSDMAAAKIKPSIYTLNGMVKVYGKCGMSDKALDLVRSMEEDYGIKPTVVVFTCLVSGLIRQKKYQDAYAAFQWMGETTAPDAQSTQTMITGLADGQMWKQLLDLAAAEQESKRGRPPSEAACLNYALQAMLSRGQVQHARSLYKIMVKKDVEVTVNSIRRRLNLPA